MPTLSVVISTYNRAASLERTLSSVKHLAEEIIVVDNTSDDNTVQVAKKYTKNVYTKPNNRMLNVNKNFGISKASCDWVLYLDDDEVVTDELSAEIKHTILHAQAVGYWIPRKNIIFGKWIRHGIWSPDNQLRLFMKRRGLYPAKHVHEYISVDGETEYLSRFLVHYNYETINQYLHKMLSIYIDSEVEKLHASSYAVQWYDALRFPLSDFLKLYFAQQGWKDGLHGLVLAMLQSFYSFLVFAKLWERSDFREVETDLRQIQHEFAHMKKESDYWLQHAVIHERKGLPALLAKIHRKFFTV